LPEEVSKLPVEWSSGYRDVLDQLMPLVYEELRRLAHGHMARERVGHTLQTTALVNEVYLKRAAAARSARVSTPRFFFWLAPLFDDPRFPALEEKLAHSAISGVLVGKR
jgi:hypothetical protein